MAEKTARTPFPRGVCPVEGCDVEGTIPGLKRHVFKTHKSDWKPLFNEPAAPLNVTELPDKLDALRKLGKERGIKGAHSMKKADLVAVLSEGNVGALN